MVSANKVISFFDELSIQIALRLNIPWAKNYIPFVLAAVAFLILFIIYKKIFKPAVALILMPFDSFRNYALNKARSRAEKKIILKRIKKAITADDNKLAAELNQSINENKKAVQLYLEAKEYASAASIYEETEDFEKAALCFSEAGNNTRAAENFLKIKDFKNAALMYENGGFSLKAAELYESAGDFAKSAELYEICFIKEGLNKTAGSSGERYAYLSGKLFEKASNFERAIQIFLRANLYNEAALLYEAKKDFSNAAENYLRSENLDKAAECFQKGSDSRRSNEALSVIYYKKGLIKEAAFFAEKSGDFLNSAEMLIESGEYAQAGALYAKKGYFNEAGEMFLKINDFLRAAEAFEKAGKYVSAANAYLKTGDSGLKSKGARLFEKGEEYFEAGNIFMQLNTMDRALKAFQKIDAGSPNYNSASVLIGQIFLQKGMVKLAIEKFSKAIANESVNRANLELYYYLGICLEMSKEREKATVIYEKILAEDYDFRDVSQRLSRLTLLSEKTSDSSQ